MSNATFNSILALVCLAAAVALAIAIIYSVGRGLDFLAVGQFLVLCVAVYGFFHLLICGGWEDGDGRGEV